MEDTPAAQSTFRRDHIALESVQKKDKMTGVARHTFGLILLLCVVITWTASNFMGSSLFAQGNYAKPFLVTYINTSAFIFAMIPTLLKEMFLRYRAGNLRSSLKQIFRMETLRSFWTDKQYSIIDDEDGDGAEGEAAAFIKPSDTVPISSGTQAELSREEQPAEYLGLIPTARHALAFCLLWFGANYFAMACLQHTTVASTTILTSTSSVWTLLIGAISRIEKFTWRKLCGVLTSIAGIVLISRVDLSVSATDASASDDSSVRLFLRAITNTPERSVGEIALGDALALLSAIVYGLYTIMLKQTTLKAAPLELNMLLFFALVGVFNIILFLPMFPLLHYTGVETFEMPHSGYVWFLLFTISISSMLSDIAWGYAMVMTSPLVATVALSLNIPFSLVGEMFIQGRYEGWVYWVGAMIVVGSFVFVEREEVKEEMISEEETQERRSLVLEDGLVGGDRRGRVGDRARGDLLGGGDGDVNESDDEDDRTRDRLQRQANGYTELDR